MLLLYYIIFMIHELDMVLFKYKIEIKPGNPVLEKSTTPSEMTKLIFFLRIRWQDIVLSWDFQRIIH